MPTRGSIIRVAVMPAQPLGALVREHSVDGAHWKSGPGGLPFLAVETDRCTARLTPYGGQLCEWTPAGQKRSALFLSPRSAFAAGKAIRGGVPICFPWFGNHPTDKTRPAHGFARTRMWDVVSITRSQTNDVVVTLRLTPDADTRALRDAEFLAMLVISLGTSLELAFTVENTGHREIAYEVALHSYVAVSDVERIRIQGIERTRFIDKVDSFREKTAGAEPLVLTGETDRVFLETETPCVVDDRALARRIRIEKSGSRATVVWNPWQAKAEAMADVGGDAWRSFVCVETANCGPHVVRLDPHARHTMTARMTVEH